MIRPHIKVIQRNGVDIFVTSSIRYAKPVFRGFSASNSLGSKYTYDRWGLSEVLMCAAPMIEDKGSQLGERLTPLTLTYGKRV